MVQRLEKLLEDTGIKLCASPPTSWASPDGPCSKPSFRGETDPQVLADLAKRKLRNKIPELTEP